MLAAFDKSTFIDWRDPAYEPLVARIRAGLPESAVQSMDRRGASLREQFRELFEMLLSYRLNLEPALDFTSGTLEADGLYIFALEKAGEINRASDLIWESSTTSLSR